MLTWDETEAIACLEVLPEKDEEYQTWYCFTVTQASLTLTLTIEPYTGDVRFCLNCDSLPQPIVEFVLYDCPKIRYVQDQVGHRRDYLEFATTTCGGAYTSRWDDQLLRRGVRLSVKPQLSIQLF